MIKAAEGVLKSIFSPTPNYIALILTDKYSSSIATAFKTALKNKLRHRFLYNFKPKPYFTMHGNSMTGKILYCLNK